MPHQCPSVHGRGTGSDHRSKKGGGRDEEDRYPYCAMGTCCFVPYCRMSAGGLKTGTAAGTNLSAGIYSTVLAAGKSTAAVLLGLFLENRRMALCKQRRGLFFSPPVDRTNAVPSCRPHRLQCKDHPKIIHHESAADVGDHRTGFHESEPLVGPYGLCVVLVHEEVECLRSHPQSILFHISQHH
jgi:hypothetical protein